MRVGVWLMLAVLPMCAQPQTGAGWTRGIESKHRHGPAGLESWTLNYYMPPPDHPGEAFPRTLVLARHGHIFRRIKGEHFVWNWVFLDGGRQLAYESGPLHFSMACLLVDVESGRELGRYDCFMALPANAPGWVKVLEQESMKPE